MIRSFKIKRTINKSNTPYLVYILRVAESRQTSNRCNYHELYADNRYLTSLSVVPVVPVLPVVPL